MLIFDQLKRNDRQLQYLAAVVLLGMLTLVGRLWFVQVVSSQHYQEDLETQSFRSVRLPAVRGKILDRYGQPLAENRPRYNVDIYLEELSKYFQSTYTNELAKTRAELGRYKLTAAERAPIAPRVRYQVVSNLVALVSQIIQQPLTLDEKKFRQHYDQRLALPLTIAENLTPDQVARFVEKSTSLPGVDLEIQAVRSYPRKSAAAHIVGYLQKDDASDEDEDAYYNYRLPDFKGIIGIEGNYDTELRGRAGSKSMLVNNLGYRQTEQIWNQPQPGQSVVLTIDLRLQEVAEQALRAVYPNTRGAVVVMDARNGDILTLASAPAYDPNVFVPSINRTNYDRLIDPQLRPMINRATFGAYPPGSIFKIIVALAGLEAGTLQTNESIFNPGYYRLGRRTIDDTAPKGKHDFRSAFKHSSNTYFIWHGLKMGPDKIIQMGERFHLGEATGVLPRQEVAGDFPSIADVASGWVDGETANISIGQGAITVTPLQMAVMTAAIANGGKVFWPRLVNRIEAQESKEVIAEFLPGQVRQELKVNPHNLNIIREAMLADVEDAGTGSRALVAGMSVCGKTGTAQIMQGSRTVDHITWFVSFAPYDEPRYVVVVMVESGSSGGGTCAPVAQKIYQEIQRLENTSRERRSP